MRSRSCSRRSPARDGRADLPGVVPLQPRDLPPALGAAGAWASCGGRAPRRRRILRTMPVRARWTSRASSRPSTECSGGSTCFSATPRRRGRSVHGGRPRGGLPTVRRALRRGRPQTVRPRGLRAAPRERGPICRRPAQALMVSALNELVFIIQLAVAHAIRVPGGGGGLRDHQGRLKRLHAHNEAPSTNGARVAQDDYYYEIQLTNKAAGLLLPRRRDRPHPELPRRASWSAGESTRPQAAPTPRRPAPCRSRESSAKSRRRRPAPLRTGKDLSYAQRLEADRVDDALSRPRPSTSPAAPARRLLRRPRRRAGSPAQKPVLSDAETCRHRDSSTRRRHPVRKPAGAAPKAATPSPAPTPRATPRRGSFQGCRRGVHDPGGGLQGQEQR